MKAPFRLALALVALLPLAARAYDPATGPHYPDVVTTEQGIETDTQLTQLPSGVPGAVTVNVCVGCKSRTLSVTSATRFFIGQNPVPLADLRARVAAGPKTFLMVYADPKQPVATRIVLFAQNPTVPVRSR
jgi:hypothetical protein